MKSGIRLTEKGNGKGEEKGYNSRFTSNTETVSRVACYLYIKATWKLAASLAYGIHRSIYRLFLSFPLLSSLDEFLIFPPPSPPLLPLPPPCFFYSRYAPVVSLSAEPAAKPPTLGRFVVFSPLLRLFLLVLLPHPSPPVADTSAKNYLLGKFLHR